MSLALYPSHLELAGRRKKSVAGGWNGGFSLQLFGGWAGHITLEAALAPHPGTHTLSSFAWLP